MRDSWVHPESLVDRLILEKECVQNRLAFARYEGRFLSQCRAASGEVRFRPFRATELINFTFDADGGLASILSYFVNLRPDDDLSPQWLAYLSGAHPVPAHAVAVADRVRAPCHDTTSTAGPVPCAPMPAPAVPGVATPASVAEVPDSIVVDLDTLWTVVRVALWPCVRHAPVTSAVR